MLSGLTGFPEAVRSCLAVDDILSGPLLLSWRKLSRYVTEYRAELQRDTMYEWFQWLAERMQQREVKHSPVPAYVAHRDWRE